MHSEQKGLEYLHSLNLFGKSPRDFGSYYVMSLRCSFEDLGKVGGYQEILSPVRQLYCRTRLNKELCSLYTVT
jgi:hypothetical protein